MNIYIVYVVDAKYLLIAQEVGKYIYYSIAIGSGKYVYHLKAIGGGAY